MQIGGRIDERGVLVVESGRYWFRRDAGGRWELEMHGLPDVLPGVPARLVGTVISPQLVAVQELMPIF